MKFKELIKKLEIDERYTKPRTNVQTVFNKVKDGLKNMIDEFEAEN